MEILARSLNCSESIAMLLLETYTQLMDLDCGLCGRTADVQTVNF